MRIPSLNEKSTSSSAPNPPPAPEAEIGNPEVKVLTLGDGWTDLYEESLARQLARQHHTALGDPKFRLTLTDLAVLLSSDRSENEMSALLERLNRKTQNAGELLYRYNWFCATHDILLIDNRLLDTAIGQHCLEQMQPPGKPVYGVGVDGRTSPLAAAYVKGILYPRTADDLVLLVQNELQPRQKTK